MQLLDGEDNTGSIPALETAQLRLLDLPEPGITECTRECVLSQALSKRHSLEVAYAAP